MALEGPSPAILRFGVFELDMRARELRKQGVHIKLQDQPFRVLTLLLERPGELVSREQLRSQIWRSNTFIDFDNGLNTSINKLREALGDSADTPRFIETLPRRGYRLIAPVERSDRNGQFKEPRDGAIESVAVLPFVNDSGDSNAEYLSDGITESLINNLSQLPNLRVMARSTVFRYKGKDADPQEAGNDLHVRAVLIGRLLQHVNMLIVRAELMDVTTGAQLWGGQFNRKAEDVFALQDDLSREIAEKLRLRLTGDEKQRLAKRYTENPDAYRLYLQGRYHWNKRSPEGSLRALEYFGKAVDTDPVYALAYAGLADTYTQLSFFNVFPPCEVMPRARVEAEKALQIDNALGEAHVVLGYISFTYDFDWGLAGKQFDEALALNPAYTRSQSHYSFYLSSVGRSREAIALANSARQLDPVSPAMSHSLAVQFYLAREFDKTIEECRRTLELDPNYPVANAVMGQAYAAKGMYPEALQEFENFRTLSQNSAWSVALSGYAHAVLGERTAALQSIEQLSASSTQRYTPAFYFALVYAGLGDKNQAFACLDKAYEERFTRLAYLKQEAFWDPLRTDQRFSAILRRIGNPP
jgi:TolB-like protein/Tfp pilus assembly protein PilF